MTTVLITVALLLANGFFVGAEFAAMSARRSQLEPLADAPAGTGDVWVFSGFGSQHRKMAKELIARSPLFARRMRELDEMVQFQAGWSMLEIIENAKVPIIVDAGVGTASDAAIAMELGCDGVLMNTAIAGAKDPVRMARAMRLAVEAGRDAFLAGRIPRKRFASASSPVDGLIG